MSISSNQLEQIMGKEILFKLTNAMLTPTLSYSFYGIFCLLYSCVPAGYGKERRNDQSFTTLVSLGVYATFSLSMSLTLTSLSVVALHLPPRLLLSISLVFSPKSVICGPAALALLEELVTNAEFPTPPRPAKSESAFNLISSHSSLCSTI